MASVQIDELLPGQQPQPQEERQRRPGGPLGEAAGVVGIGVLEDVGRVDAALQAQVEAEPDHAAGRGQRGEQFGPRLVVAGLGSPSRSFGISASLAMDRPLKG